MELTNCDRAEAAEAADVPRFKDCDRFLRGTKTTGPWVLLPGTKKRPPSDPRDSEGADRGQSASNARRVDTDARAARGLVQLCMRYTQWLWKPAMDDAERAVALTMDCRPMSVAARYQRAAASNPLPRPPRQRRTHCQGMATRHVGQGRVQERCEPWAGAALLRRARGFDVMSFVDITAADIKLVMFYLHLTGALCCGNLWALASV